MRVGDKVHIINGDYAGDSGIIDERTELLSNPDLCFVKVSDGYIVKCSYGELELVEDPAPSNTITLTREDFENAVAKVLKPSVYISEFKDLGTVTAMCLSGELVCKKLTKELFGDND